MSSKIAKQALLQTADDVETAAHSHLRPKDMIALAGLLRSYAAQIDMTETERLDWLLRHTVYITETELPTPYTRADIDAQMKPAPKFRPWTQAEGHGKDIFFQGMRYTLTATSEKAAMFGGGAWPWESILRDATQPDGTPCGVEVKP